METINDTQTKNKPKSIKELCENKPSKAIMYMVNGLKNQSQRKDFFIRMMTFGDYEIVNQGDHVCFGCAATCTIQEVAGKNIYAKNIKSYNKRADLLGFDGEDLLNFEYTINSFRLGDFLSIFKYFDIEITDEIHPIESLHPLASYDWQDNIESYRKYAEQLEALGY